MKIKLLSLCVIIEKNCRGTSLSGKHRLLPPPLNNGRCVCNKSPQVKQLQYKYRSCSFFQPAKTRPVKTGSDVWLLSCVYTTCITPTHSQHQTKTH